MSKLVWLAVMLVLLGAIAPAQTNLTDWNTVKALATGASVRITTGSRTVGGRVLRVTDDSLVLSAGKTQEMFPQNEVKRVLLRGDSHRGRNSLIGLGIGGAAGAVIGAAAHQDCTGWCFFNTSRGADAAGGAIGLGGIGAIVGALIPSRSWFEVYRQ
ncbi:MAG TPA: hypothetical protein VGQ49_09600 [Bryobacteraceae bacterium]|jgi:hypothetical protein|nr:hypothetical protein [Bryobacteraceae bacterium]